MNFCPSGKPLERAACSAKCKCTNSSQTKGHIFKKSMNSLVKRQQLCNEMIYSFHTKIHIFSQMDKPFFIPQFLCRTDIISSLNVVYVLKKSVILKNHARFFFLLNTLALEHEIICTQPRKEDGPLVCRNISYMDSHAEYPGYVKDRP